MEIIPMSSLRPGESGTVQSMDPSEDMRQRMQDIGLITGTQVICVGRSPLGDPAAFCIRGAVIALRDTDSARVTLRR